MLMRDRIRIGLLGVRGSRQANKRYRDDEADISHADLRLTASILSRLHRAPFLRFRIVGAWRNEDYLTVTDTASRMFCVTPVWVDVAATAIDIVYVPGFAETKSDTL